MIRVRTVKQHIQHGVRGDFGATTNGSLVKWYDYQVVNSTHDWFEMDCPSPSAYSRLNLQREPGQPLPPFQEKQ